MTDTTSGKSLRLGILGGTFDPIHCGHLELARAARDAARLDEVWIVPSNVPPHKPGQALASPFHRFAMVALAVASLDAPWLIACDMELAQVGPSFTAKTLARVVGAGHDPGHVFFISGADAFAEIDTWREYPALLGMTHFIVVSRPGVAVESMRTRMPELAVRMISLPSAGPFPAQPSILLVDAPTADVSSTEVRRRLAAGLPLEGRVPAAVERHAIRHGLYRA